MMKKTDYILDQHKGKQSLVCFKKKKKKKYLKNIREEDIKNATSIHIRSIPWKSGYEGLKNFFVIDLIFMPICM